ncbi:MAG: xanthine dehydrogenase family protein subunit M [Candidatus Rokubacteria bacterium]|nr:xanthine dehydrogenase family protein subunit M [Candidatus Rokubacteria bacterium]
MTPEPFEYLAPASLGEATSLVRDLGDDAKVLAGGQSLLGLLKLRLSSPRYVVDLGRIGGLDHVRDEGDALAIGAMVTYAQLVTSALVRTKCPLLSQAAAVIGDVQVRNRGTIGGALAHADPASDMCAAVLALDGRLKLVSVRGERWVDASSFFVSVYTSALERDEILAEIRVPVLTGWTCAYLKAARRPSDFALVGVAVRAQIRDRTCADLAMAITGVADRALRARSVEQTLRGARLDAERIREAAAGAMDGVDVTGDIHASTEYRTQLARVYVARAIDALL